MPQHQSALPSDSGPAAWRWRWKGKPYWSVVENIPEWAKSKPDQIDTQPLYAALAPATEVGTVTHPSAYREGEA